MIITPGQSKTITIYESFPRGATGSITLTKRGGVEVQLNTVRIRGTFAEFYIPEEHLGLIDLPARVELEVNGVVERIVDLVPGASAGGVSFEPLSTAICRGTLGGNFNGSLGTASNVLGDYLEQATNGAEQVLRVTRTGLYLLVPSVSIFGLTSEHQPFSFYFALSGTAPAPSYMNIWQTAVSDSVTALAITNEAGNVLNINTVLSSTDLPIISAGAAYLPEGTIFSANLMAQGASVPTGLTASATVELTPIILGQD